MNVFDTLSATSRLAALTKALKTAGLDGSLKTTQNLTVFAPTDAAFALLQAVTGRDLTTDANPEVGNLLRYHVTTNDTSALAAGASYPSLFAAPSSQLAITSSDATSVTVNKLTKLLRADKITATNGTIYVIDSVLVPPDQNAALALNQLTLTQLVSVYPMLSTLSTALANGSTTVGLNGGATQKVSQLLGGATGSYTLLAPTNDAFATFKGTLPQDAAALGEILVYHTLTPALSAPLRQPGSKTTQLVTNAGPQKLLASTRGGVYYLNQLTEITAFDVNAKNGVIHLVDSLLLPPATSGTLTLTQIVGSYPLLGALSSTLGVGTVATGGQTKTVSTVLDDAEKSGGVTLFAPINAAFANLPASYVAGLKTDANKAAELGAVLAYHALSSKQTSDALRLVAGKSPGNKTSGALDDDSLPSVQGGRLRFFSTSAGGDFQITINATTLVLKDILAQEIPTQNGVIHLLDSVLMPTAAADDETTLFPGTAPQFAAAYPSFSNLLDSLARNGLAPMPSSPDAATVTTPANAAPFTLFAPNNRAFASNSLTQSAQSELILKTHLVSAAIDKTAIDSDARAMPTAMVLPTESGSSLTPSFTGILVPNSPLGLAVKTLGTAGSASNLLRADIKVKCNTGAVTNDCIVHVIDRVLAN